MLFTFQMTIRARLSFPSLLSFSIRFYFHFPWLKLHYVLDQSNYTNTAKLHSEEHLNCIQFLPAFFFTFLDLDQYIIKSSTHSNTHIPCHELLKRESLFSPLEQATSLHCTPQGYVLESTSTTPDTIALELRREIWSYCRLF